MRRRGAAHFITHWSLILNWIGSHWMDTPLSAAGLGYAALISWMYFVASGRRGLERGVNAGTMVPYSLSRLKFEMLLLLHAGSFTSFLTQLQSLRW